MRPILIDRTFRRPLWLTLASALVLAGFLAAVAARPTAVAAQSSFARGDRVAVNVGGLNLRASAGLGAEIKTVLPFGTTATVIEPPGPGLPRDGYTWYRIDAGTSFGTGWVAGELLRLAGGGGVGLGSQVIIDADGGLNYRQRPGLGAAVIVVLSDGTQASILDGPVHADGYTWWQLGLPGYGPDGKAPGWVAGEFLVLA
jgi:hypothetical protein